jgi:hypothetical protein
MLTRFRIEATGKSRNEVQDELLKAVGEIAKAIRTQNGQTGHWVCTDDVIFMERDLETDKPRKSESNRPTGNYKGRMVMTYRGWRDE